MNLSTLEEKIAREETYKIGFDSLYDGQISNRNIRNAISTYIRNLGNFNSRFDQSMKSEKVILNKAEVDGFNLFMGKAACATCHFPPAFNGTIPPKYSETELENIGVPANSDFTHMILDTDSGAYYPYNVSERVGFFKTPTIRNVSLTAPYMHNGVFKELNEVMKFYNLGGGAGIGLEVPHQTLPADSLHLSEYEISSIVSFMKTLDDESPSTTL